MEALQESGVLGHLYRNSVPYASLCLSPESFRRPNNNMRPLELGDLYGVLSLYAGGKYFMQVNQSEYLQEAKEFWYLQLINLLCKI